MRASDVVRRMKEILGMPSRTTHGELLDSVESVSEFFGPLDEDECERRTRQVRPWMEAIWKVRDACCGIYPFAGPEEIADVASSILKNTDYWCLQASAREHCEQRNSYLLARTRRLERALEVRKMTMLFKTNEGREGWLKRARREFSTWHGFNGNFRGTAAYVKEDDSYWWLNCDARKWVRRDDVEFWKDDQFKEDEQ